MKTAAITLAIIAGILLAIFPPIGVTLLIPAIILIIIAICAEDNKKQNNTDAEFELWVKKQEYLEERKAQKAKAEKVNHDLDEIEAELDRRISDPERGINPDLRIVENRKN